MSVRGEAGKEAKKKSCSKCYLKFFSFCVSLSTLNTHLVNNFAKIQTFNNRFTSLVIIITIISADRIENFDFRYVRENYGSRSNNP